MQELEEELRRQDLWETSVPPPRAFDSSLPFCCDTMRFTQWLQWVLIPHTRALAEAGGPMPEASGIRPMAEEALRGCAWQSARLLALLGRFDSMINRGAC